METLEFKIRDIEHVEVSIDNHLVGWFRGLDWVDEVFESDRFSIPLPEGNWIILSETKGRIKIGNLNT